MKDSKKKLPVYFGFAPNTYSDKMLMLHPQNPLQCSTATGEL